jgi:hypothetical protein
VKLNLIIDILAALIYLVAANPLITGWAVHEWISLGLILILIVHCAVHYDWLIQTIKRHTERASIANLILNVVTLVVFAVVTVSGLAVSRHILPLFGLVSGGYFFWVPVHAISAKVLLALIVVHVAVHAKWIVAALRVKSADKVL